MIILNSEEVEDAHSPSKRSLALSDASFDPEAPVQGPPPAYDDSVPELPVSSTPLLHPRAKRSAFRRFLRALIVALLIYATLSAIIIPSLIAVAKRVRKDRRWSPPTPPTLPPVPGHPTPPALPTLPIPPRRRPGPPSREAQRMQCYNFPETPTSPDASAALLAPLPLPSQLPDLPLIPELDIPSSHDPAILPHLSKTSFDFPANLSLLFLHSAGRSASGAVTVVPSRGPAEKISVSIDVHRSLEPDVQIEICTMRIDDSRQGLTIHVTDNGDWASTMASFDVRVELPSPEYWGLPALETLLENFSHDVGPFTGEELFPHVALSSTNSRIHVEGLRAEYVTIETRNGGISGIFNVSHTLDLMTNNGPINLGDTGTIARNAHLRSVNGHVKGSVTVTNSIEVTATNGAVNMHLDLINDDTESPTRASIQATNNQLNANFSLITLDQFGQVSDGGSFDVSTRTTNGYTCVAVLDQPALSNLSLRVQSTNDGADVELSPSYEGSFVVRSLPFRQPSVQSIHTELAGMTRLLQMREGRYNVTGRVENFDVDRPDHGRHGSGTVDIDTFRGQCELLL